MIGFLDASALIYLVDGEASWALAAQATLRQLASEGPGLQLAVSRLSGLECRVDPLVDQPGLLVVELSAPVLDLATRLRANYDLRTPDALQAACCLQLGPDAVMISGDAGFQRVQALQVRLIA